MLISAVEQTDSVIHIYVVFHIHFYHGLSQDVDYSSLCYTVGPCCLSFRFWYWLPSSSRYLLFKKYIYFFDQSFVSSVSLLSLSGTLSAPGLDSDIPSWAAAVFLLSCANLPHAWTNISPVTTADLPFPTADCPLTLLGSDILPDT